MKNIFMPSESPIKTEPENGTNVFPIYVLKYTTYAWIQPDIQKVDKLSFPCPYSY
jgi:hypothetical protein